MSLQRTRNGSPLYPGLGVLVMSLALAACGGGEQPGTSDTASARETPTAVRSSALVAQPSNTERRCLSRLTL